jgi:hypothetical protein
MGFASAARKRFLAASQHFEFKQGKRGKIAT